MKPAKYFPAFCLAGFAALAAVASANDVREESIEVQFAVLPDHEDPIAGTVTCKVDQTCLLLDRKQPRFALHLRIIRERDDLVSELQVRCEGDCSFATGRSRIRFRDTGGFDLFKGEDRIETPLVLKPREKIGRIMLVYT